MSNRMVFTYTRINGVETQKWVDEKGKVNMAVVGRINPHREVAAHVEETPIVETEVVDIDTSFLDTLNARTRANREKERARIEVLYKEDSNKKNPIKSFIKGLLK